MFVDIRWSLAFPQINLVCRLDALFLSLSLASQEPGTNEEIQQFCQLNYGVTFPVLSKIEVNGDNADPVYKYLKKNKSGVLGISRVKYRNPTWES